MNSGLKHLAIVGGALLVVGGALVWKFTRPSTPAEPAKTPASVSTTTPDPNRPDPAHGGVKPDPKPNPAQVKLEEEAKYLAGSTPAAQKAREVRTRLARPESMRSFVHDRNYGAVCAFFTRNLDETLPLLTKMAAEDPVGPPRAWALAILAPLKRPDLEPLFVDRVEKDDFAGAVVNAARGLATLDSARGQEAVRARIDKEPKEEIRAGLQKVLQDWK